MELQIQVCDCVDGMRELPSESVDVAITSPPYNIGASYRSYRDNLARLDYLEWSETWAAEIQRVLRPDGALFLNVSAAKSDPTLPFELVLRLTKELFRLQNVIHWVKSISLALENGEILSKGHFKPINSARYLNDCCEPIFHLTKSGTVRIDRLAVGVPYADKSNIARWGHTSGRDRRCAGNVWFIPYETIRDRGKDRPHPATFPVELAERCIKLHGKVAPVVMDPFLGLGSTAEAAANRKAGRFVGFEIDPEYAGHALRRCTKEPAEPQRRKPVG